MQEMKSLGFMEVYNLVGGLTAWQEAGYYVIKSEPSPTTAPPPTTTVSPVPTVQTDCDVLAILLPSAQLSDTSIFSIFIVVTNSKDRALECDLDINIYKEADLTLYTTYTVHADLAVGETKLMAFDEAQLPETFYIVQAGEMTARLLVG